MLSVSLTRLQRRLVALSRFGGLLGGGVTRPAWSPQHEEARAWLITEMRGAGLATWVDPAGNTFGSLGATALASDRPAVLTGSHIDTVPEGGMLDGALGVIAGLECLEVLAKTKTAHQRPLAAADYALRAREHVVTRGTNRSVTNIGVVHVHPGASNIVPGRAELVHEMRDPDVAVLERLWQECRGLADSVARERQIAVDVVPMSATVPALAAPRVQASIEAACRSLGLTSQRMYSAAGHDAQNLAAITDMGMLFIPSKGGRSHRVDEMSDWDAIERGANTLLHTLLTLARA